MKTYWHYEICKQDGRYSIREVYISDDGSVSFTAGLNLDNYESKESLIATLEMMLKDAKKHKVRQLR